MYSDDFRAFVYCHNKDLQAALYLREKAIRFAQERKIQIVDFSATDVISTIRRMTQEKINILLINDHSLTEQEYRILRAYCQRNNITIVYFEKQYN